MSHVQVCEDQCCEDVVLPLATNLLDRFLSRVHIKKSQLQLLGSACMLISSKMRQCRALSGETLCYYTDHSITLNELIVSSYQFIIVKLHILSGHIITMGVKTGENIEHPEIFGSATTKLK